MTLHLNWLARFFLIHLGVFHRLWMQYPGATRILIKSLASDGP